MVDSAHPAIRKPCGNASSPVAPAVVADPVVQAAPADNLATAPEATDNSACLPACPFPDPTASDLAGSAPTRLTEVSAPAPVALAMARVADSVDPADLVVAADPELPDLVAEAVRAEAEVAEQAAVVVDAAEREEAVDVAALPAAALRIRIGAARSTGNTPTSAIVDDPNSRPSPDR